MIEDGRAYGVAMILQALLDVLKRKNLLSNNEITAMLDSVGDEIRDLEKSGAISPNAAAKALLAMGLMHVPPRDPPKT